MRRHTVAINLAVVLLVLATTRCRPESGRAAYSRATVYFIGWDLETRQRLTPEDVRRLARARPVLPHSTSNPSELNALVRHLELGALTKADSLGEDPRLVIELVDSNGRVVTYFASRFKLVAADNTQAHSINGAFRARFTVDNPPKW